MNKDQMKGQKTLEEQVLELEDLDNHQKNGSKFDPFKECASYLESNHVMDDLFHEKEME